MQISMSERPQNKHLKHWPKGVSGNPLGKPKQLLTKDKVKSVLGKFCDMSIAELQAVANNPNAKMLEVMVANIMIKAAETGDYSRLDFILNRSIGKVPNDQNESQPESTSSMTIEEKIQWLKSTPKTAI